MSYFIKYQLLKMSTLGSGVLAASKIPILVLCGPSGSGKSTLLKKLLSEFDNKFGFSISHTTRSPRPGETNGVDYHYVTRDEMQQAIKNGDFVEFAEFSGNIYGTSKKSISDVLYTQRICILDIDVQGVKQLKQIPDFQSKQRLVFINPPSLNTLKARLVDRGTETEESLAKRLAVAQAEIDYGITPGNFDLVIVNDEVDKAYGKLREFILPDIQQLEKEKTQTEGGDGDK
ncbi:guanylate kinase [Folsomia candida]|uniref:guanylate kinase n=1 Tax=Folsomia candida TaxID=158441 RepID=UPI000B8F509B|nr:guanylate kinase [Folsomia candida]